MKKKHIDWMALGLTFLLIVWGIFHFIEKPYGDFSYYVGISQIVLGSLIVYFRFIRRRKE